MDRANTHGLITDASVATKPGRRYLRRRILKAYQRGHRDVGHHGRRHHRAIGRGADQRAGEVISVFNQTALTPVMHTTATNYRATGLALAGRRVRNRRATAGLPDQLNQASTQVGRLTDVDATAGSSPSARAMIR